MGGSKSKVEIKHEQELNNTLLQTFSGSCDVNCTNTITGGSIHIIGSDVDGDVGFTQKCTADSQCLIGSSLEAVADLRLKSDTNSNAKAATGIFNPAIWGETSSKTSTRQVVNNLTKNDINQKCGTTALNELKDVSIIVEGSNISGNVMYDQTGDAKGACTLNFLSKALATSTGYAESKSTGGAESVGEMKTGKGMGKATKKGKGWKTGGTMTWVIVGVVVVGVVGAIAWAISQKGKGEATDSGAGAGTSGDSGDPWN